MLRAGDLLFFGGSSADPPGGPSSPATTEGAGNNRGSLQVLSCRQGETVGELEIASPPVWDALAAAQGRLFIPCEDGSVVCLESR
jgi:hypothetical protein